MAQNGNFILPASTQHASQTKAGVVKIGTGINVDNAGIITTDMNVVASKLNAHLDVDVNVDAGGKSGGSAVIRRTAGSDVNKMQDYITIWVKSYKYAHNGLLNKDAYNAFMTNDSAKLIAVNVPTADKLAEAGITGAQLTNAGLAAGNPINPFIVVFKDGLEKVFEIQDKNGQDLFAVKANGDTWVAGVIEITGSGLSRFNGDVEIGGNLTVLENATVKGIMENNKMTITGDLEVQGNTTLGQIKDGVYDTTTINGLTTIHASSDKADIDAKMTAWLALAGTKSMNGGAGPTRLEIDAKKTEFGAINVFEIKDSKNAALFEVKGNGDTVIGGVITVNGQGESYFAGNVNIAGNLNVDGSITNGTKVDIGQDLEVKGTLRVDGDTYLGDDASVDKITMKGATSITTALTKANVQGLKDAFYAAHKFDVTDIPFANFLASKFPGVTVAGATAYHKQAFCEYSVPDYGKDIFVIFDGSEVKDVNGNVTTAASKLFQVKGNGDTIFAGVITVNGNGESFFAGDVTVGGRLNVVENAQNGTGAQVNLGDSLEVKGDLIVDGDTYLGNDAGEDSVTIKGLTTIFSKSNKDAGGIAAAFEVKSKDNFTLFQVQENGSVTIAGNADIGGGLKVEGNAEVKAVFSGKDLNLDGNLNVQGNTTLGDDAAVDTTLIKGVTTIKSGVLKTAAGADQVNVFHVVDSNNSELFEVRQNGDAVIAGKLTVNSTGSSFAGNVSFEGDVSIGGNLTVDGSASVKAALSGNDLDLIGNLVVHGNTTLGDADSDTVDIKTTLNMNNHKIVNVADPMTLTDAANKGYVDNYITGLDVKQSVKAATTGQITLSGLFSIDGVALNDGDRVLVKNQGNLVDNGIYIAKAGTWTRSDDAQLSDITPGLFTFVEQGTLANSGWVLTAETGKYTQFAGAGSLTAGAGMNQNGTQFSLKPATDVELGGVMVAAQTAAQPLAVDAQGHLSIQVASGSKLGVVKAGTGIAIDADGTIKVGSVGSSGASLDNVSQDATANSIAQRDAEGDLTAHDLILTGRVAKVNNITTAGAFGVQTAVAAATNGLVSVKTTDTVIASFTPTVSGGFLIYTYFKVTQDAALDLVITYSDGQDQIQVLSEMAGGQQPVNAYSAAPLYIYAVAGTPIVVKAKSDVVDKIQVNASIAAI